MPANHPADIVDAVARELWRVRFYAPDHKPTTDTELDIMEGYRADATALLDRITPGLVAAERQRKHIPGKWIRQGTHADMRADGRAYVVLTRGHWSYAASKAEPVNWYATREEAQAAADIAIPAGRVRARHATDQITE